MKSKTRSTDYLQLKKVNLFIREVSIGPFDETSFHNVMIMIALLSALVN